MTFGLQNQDYAKEIELKYSMFKKTQNRYRQLAVERISEVFPGKSSLSKIETAYKGIEVGIDFEVIDKRPGIFSRSKTETLSKLIQDTLRSIFNE